MDLHLNIENSLKWILLLFFPEVTVQITVFPCQGMLAFFNKNAFLQAAGKCTHWSWPASSKGTMKSIKIRKLIFKIWYSLVKNIKLGLEPSHHLLNPIFAYLLNWWFHIIFHFLLSHNFSDIWNNELFNIFISFIFLFGKCQILIGYLHPGSRTMPFHHASMPNAKVSFK